MFNEGQKEYLIMLIKKDLDQGNYIPIEKRNRREIIEILEDTREWVIKDTMPKSVHKKDNR